MSDVDRTAEAALTSEAQDYAWDHAQKAENLWATQEQARRSPSPLDMSDRIRMEIGLAEMWATLAAVSQRAEMIATAREMDAKAAERGSGWSSDLFRDRHRLVHIPTDGVVAGIAPIIEESETDPRDLSPGY